MLSCEQKQNLIDGKKRIILNPGEGQKRDFETATFAEGDVWGVDVLVSTSEDGKVRYSCFIKFLSLTFGQARIEESRTTIYQRDSTVSYQLKMKTSRAVFSEVQKKAGAFPFNVRVLEDEKRARMGLQEAVQHSLVTPYEVMYVVRLMAHLCKMLISNQLHPREHFRRRIPLYAGSSPRWTRLDYAAARMVQA